MTRPSTHEAYILLERVRQRVKRHRWTSPNTQAEQEALEGELWSLEEHFLGRETEEVSPPGVEAACAPC